MYKLIENTWQTNLQFLVLSLQFHFQESYWAALGPVALDHVRSSHTEGKDSSALEWADKVLVVCVLSILLTAPVGAILMTILGPRLLKKTSMPPIVEGWRRSARPSLRDITIIDEEEDGEGIAT